MKAIPLYVDGEISFAELNEIFKAAGYSLRMVGGQIIVARVPAFLRREAVVAPVNVLPIRKGIRRPQ